MHYEGIIICSAASLIGDLVCRAWGAHHAHFAVAALPLDAALAGKLLAFALPVALTAWAFLELTQAFGRWSRARLANPYLRVCAGALAVIALSLALRTPDYLNLGTEWLPRALGGAGPVPPYAFGLKLLFTALCLGSGFKGGEVTPLFVTGALLGAALAPWLGLPGAYLAAIGYVALFAAASNTPIASTLLGIELFGGGFAAPLVITCFLAYVLVGHRGIYGGHRVATPK